MFSRVFAKFSAAYFLICSIVCQIAKFAPLAKSRAKTAFFSSGFYPKHRADHVRSFGAAPFPPVTPRSALPAQAIANLSRRTETRVSGPLWPKRKKARPGVKPRAGQLGAGRRARFA